MSQSEGLFDLNPVEQERIAAAERFAGMSAGRRLTFRQREAITNGYHPLSLVAQGLKLHPDAGRDGAPGSPAAGPTCGRCSFRLQIHWRGATYAKCAFGAKPVYHPLNGAPRASHGATTDVRAWWPACSDFQPAGGDP